MKYLQLDLGLVRPDIDMLKIWHYYSDGRAYNHKLEISSDGLTWHELFNSDINGKYKETAEGRTYVLNETYTESRLKAAELKITDSAIISTVQSTINNAKTEAINSANSATDTKLQSYATKASMELTSM
ncbi:hypothetical protein GNF82_20055, partial [Clostridium perfringens]